MQKQHYKLGVFIEYDTIGRFKYHTNEDEIVLINNVLERGFGAQITLGMDSTRERVLSYGGSLGLDYILTVFIPELRKSGVSDQYIEMMTVYNPRRALVFKDPVRE
jgi:predicted metal-dependent phosphotriesterase family hydrolase